LLSQKAPTILSPQGAPSSFLRPHLLKLAPYTPIEPFEILSQRFGRKPEDIIKLDANEVRVSLLLCFSCAL